MVNRVRIETISGADGEEEGGGGLRINWRFVEKLGDVRRLFFESLSLNMAPSRWISWGKICSTLGIICTLYRTLKTNERDKGKSERTDLTKLNLFSFLRWRSSTSWKSKFFSNTSGIRGNYERWWLKRINVKIWKIYEKLFFFFFFSIFTREYFVLNILYFHTVMKCWKVIFKPDTIFIVPFYSYWIFFLRLGGFQNDFFRRKILQIHFHRRCGLLKIHTQFSFVNITIITQKFRKFLYLLSLIIIYRNVSLLRDSIILNREREEESSSHSLNAFLNAFLLIVSRRERRYSSRCPADVTFVVQSVDDREEKKRKEEKRKDERMNDDDRKPIPGWARWEKNHAT